MVQQNKKHRLYKHLSVWPGSVLHPYSGPLWRQVSGEKKKEDNVEDHKAKSFSFRKFLASIHGIDQ